MIKVRTNYGKFNIRYVGAKVWNLIDEKLITNKRLIKPLLVVRVAPGTNPKYGSHWTKSLIAT